MTVVRGGAAVVAHQDDLAGLVGRDGQADVELGEYLGQARREHAAQLLLFRLRLAVVCHHAAPSYDFRFWIYDWRSAKAREKTRRRSEPSSPCHLATSARHAHQLLTLPRTGRSHRRSQGPDECRCGMAGVGWHTSTMCCASREGAPVPVRLLYKLLAVHA